MKTRRRPPYALRQVVSASSPSADVLTAADKRGLTPPFWSHILPCGEVKLDMTRPLSLSGPALPGLGEETA